MVEHEGKRGDRVVIGPRPKNRGMQDWARWGDSSSAGRYRGDPGFGEPVAASAAAWMKRMWAVVHGHPQSVQLCSIRAGRPQPVCQEREDPFVCMRRVEEVASAVENAGREQAPHIAALQTDLCGLEMVNDAGELHGMSTAHMRATWWAGALIRDDCGWGGSVSRRPIPWVLARGGLRGGAWHLTPSLRLRASPPPRRRVCHVLLRFGGVCPDHVSAVALFVDPRRYCRGFTNNATRDRCPWLPVALGLLSCWAVVAVR